jgi:hypothetical protein
VVADSEDRISNAVEAGFEERVVVVEEGELEADLQDGARQL